MIRNSELGKFVKGFLIRPSQKLKVSSNFYNKLIS